MGRTRRSRRRKLQRDLCYNVSGHQTFVRLVQWMSAKGWQLTCSLQPTLYEKSGRGFAAKKKIKKGDVLASIPYHLLMTTDVIEASPIACVFHNNQKLKFSAQEVLATYLAYEKLLGPHSSWSEYIDTLPNSFTLPLFCADDELAVIPSFISEAVFKQKEKILNSYKSVLTILCTLRSCDFCGMQHSDHFVNLKFDFDNFLWAWAVVNSRSVYLQRHRTETSIHFSDKDVLALAPYLDMFNHSNDADMLAELSSCGNFYNITTNVLYKKYSQVYIHYGHHSNLFLYLEYGFVLFNNIYDNIVLTFDEVVNVIKNICSQYYNISKEKINFISSHGLAEELTFGVEGISFNMKALIYIMTTTDSNKSVYQKKVYSLMYSDGEKKIIQEIVVELMELKHREYRNFVTRMEKKEGNSSESFETCLQLLKEHLDVLQKGFICMDS